MLFLLNNLMFPIDLVIPYYNRPDSVIRLLDSVFSQDLNEIDLQVILSDDASKELPARLLDTCKKYQVQIVRLPVNKGPGAARNFGVHAGNAPYICFIDSDDYYAGNYFQHLKKSVTALSPDIGWSATTEMTNNSAVIKNVAAWKPSSNGKFNYRDVINGVYVGIGCGFFIRRDIFNKVGGFNENLRHAEDTEFLIRLSQLNPTYEVLDVPYVVINKGGTDRVTINYTEKAKAYEIIIQNNIDYLQKNPVLLQQYQYKLGWSYLHSGNRIKGRKLLFQNLRPGFHLKSFQMLLLSFFSVSMIIKLHVWASSIKQKVR